MDQCVYTRCCALPVSNNRLQGTPLDSRQHFDCGWEDNLLGFRCPANNENANARSVVHVSVKLVVRKRNAISKSTFIAQNGFLAKKHNIQVSVPLF